MAQPESPDWKYVSIEDEKRDVWRRFPKVAGIAFGLGGASKYQGLDRSNPGLRPLIDDSIKALETRIKAQQGLPLQEITEDICSPTEYLNP